MRDLDMIDTPKGVRRSHLQWKFLYLDTPKASVKTGDAFFTQLARMKNLANFRLVSRPFLLGRSHKMEEQTYWKIGKWREVPLRAPEKNADYWENRIRCCRTGFHSSPSILAAQSYIREGTCLALVEYDGESDVEKQTATRWWISRHSKRASRRMRVVRAFVVTKEFALLLNAFRARRTALPQYRVRQLHEQVLTLPEIPAK